jgi:carboxymethylenebutenolidase
VDQQGGDQIMTDAPRQPLPDTVSWVQSSGLSRRDAIVAGSAASGFALAVQPVAASTITTPADGLDAGMIEFKAADRSMPAYRAKPAGKSNLPIVIVVQEIFGLHEWIRDMTRRYARAGFYAIAPDYYVRQGDATQIADIPKLFSDIVSKVPDAQVLADSDAAAAHAAKDGGDGKRLGMTGYCWGGRITWLYAAHNPRLKAGVACYGRLVGNPGQPASPLQPLHPVDIAARIKAPVLGLYGEKDAGIPLASVDAMMDAIKAAKGTSDITVYPDADHGFLADYRPSYNEAAARDAWLKGLAWFAEHMR